jgi:hypothetical protein
MFFLHLGLIYAGVDLKARNNTLVEFIENEADYVKELNVLVVCSIAELLFPSPFIFFIRPFQFLIILQFIFFSSLQFSLVLNFHFLT